MDRETLARPSAPISRVPYLPGLDGLRALAVVTVMVYHANSSWLHGGFLGVEVFFVISGYLITLLLIAEHEKSNRVSLGQFWLRRARRLLPALFTMMLAVMVGCALFMRDDLGKLRGDIVAGVAYVSNWYQIWTGQGYTASADFAPLRHLWSLAVEEQFYLVWPLVMMLILRRGRGRLPQIGAWLFLGALAIALVTALLYHPGVIGTCSGTPDQYAKILGRGLTRTDTLYLSTATRAGGLLLGGAMAMWWRPYAVLRSRLRDRGLLLDLGALVGAAVLALLMWHLHVTYEGPDGVQGDPRLFRGGFLFTGLATTLVIAAVTHLRAVTGKVLGNPVLNWLGLRSYGLYLYHWPVYQFIRKEAGTGLTVPQFAFAMVVTLAATEASYRWIETPIRTGRLTDWMRHNLRGRPTAKVAARRRRALAGGVLAMSLPVFAGISLVFAPLKQNDVQASLDSGSEAVTDVLENVTSSTAPGGGPSTTVGPADDGDGAGGAGGPGTTGDPAGGGAAPATSVAAGDTTTPTTSSAAVPADPASSVTPSSSVAGGDVTAETPPPDTSSTAPPPADPTATTAAATTPPDPTTPPATAPPPAPGTLDVLALGDSVMLGAAPALTAKGAVVDAKVNRQGKEGADILEALAAAGQLPNVLVIHLGTNGPASQETYDRMIHAAAGVPFILVLTVRADRTWTADNNQRIRDLEVRYQGQVHLLDWATVSDQCADKCFYEDDIHLRPNGQQFYADQVWAAIGR